MNIKFREKLGFVEVGRYADIIILDRDIFSSPIEDFKVTKVDTVITAGKVREI